MVARGFMEAPASDKDPWWFKKPISDMKSTMKSIDTYLIDKSVECSKALQIMKNNSIDCLLNFENG